MGREYVILRSVKGWPTGPPRVAEMVAAIIDDPHRFKSAKHISSYAGLVPEKHDSGQTKRNGRITGNGSGTLRALLVQISWLGLKHKWIRDIYDRIRRGSKTRSKIAIVAVARHILVRCFDKFMRRGFEACRSEWSLICATHNVLKLWRSGKACWN